MQWPLPPDRRKLYELTGPRTPGLEYQTVRRKIRATTVLRPQGDRSQWGSHLVRSTGVSESMIFSVPYSKIGLLLAVVFFVLVSLLSLDSGIKVQYDSGVYIALGKALANDHGYKDIFLVENPPHTHYPPGFPLLLTFPLLVFGVNFLIMKLMNVAIALCVICVTFAFCKHVADHRLASLVTIFTATSHGILFYSQSIMSEIPYLFFSLIALLWLHRCTQRHDWSTKATILTIALLSVVYLTRLVGIALLLATVSYLLVDGQGTVAIRARRAIIIGGITLIPALLWFGRNWLLTESIGAIYWQGYTLSSAHSSVFSIEGLPVIVDRVARNVYKYAVHFGKVIFFGFSTPQIVPLVFALCIFGGFIQKAAWHRSILEYYLSVYMLIVLLFPGTRPQRYVVPLIPFIWYYFFVFARHLLAFVRDTLQGAFSKLEPGVNVLANLFLVLLLIANGATAVWGNVLKNGKEGYYHVVGEGGYTRVLPWVRANTPPKSTFLWAKASLRFLLTGRQSYRGIERKGAALHLVRQGNVDYVVVDTFSEMAEGWLRPLISEHPQKFDLVYDDGVSKVYKVRQ